MDIFNCQDLQVGFIGAGNMARALSKGFILANKVRPQNIIVSRRNLDGLKEFASDLGVKTTSNNVEVVDNCDVLFIAVKPHLVQGVLNEVKDHITSHHLVISVAMAWSIDLLEKCTPDGTRVIRTIPNTPSLVQCGVTVYCCGQHTTDGDEKIVDSLFASVGICRKIEERLMTAVNGLSGSGPAYMFIAIEALADGAVKMGLPRDLAIELAAKTLMGAGKMALESGAHPAQLKDSVCSPGGSTICAVHKLEEGGLRQTLMNAVEASYHRSAEVEDKLSQSIL